jgi:hypothetical protein
VYLACLIDSAASKTIDWGSSPVLHDSITHCLASAGTIRSFLLACTIGVVAMSRAMHIVQIGTRLIVDRRVSEGLGRKTVLDVYVNAAPPLRQSQL